MNRKKISRREFLRVGTLGVAGAALAACVPATAPAVEEEAPAAEEDVEEETAEEVVAEEAEGAELPKDAKGAQELRIITGSSGSASFHFQCLECGGDQQNWQTFLFAAPLYFDEELTLHPYVFESWEVNDDSTEWTFYIDKAARFSNGDPLYAQDVKGTWEIQTKPENSVGRIVGYIGNVVGFDAAREGTVDTIEGLQIVDDFTLKISLVDPDPVFHYRIATCHLNPIHVESYYESPGWDEWWMPENNPPFSGPYMLEEYDADLKTATMVPNPEWWKDEGPYLEKISFVFVTDQNTAAAMILNDQADLTLSPLGPEMRDRLPDMFRPIKSFGYGTFWINPNNPPTDDINVRKALAMAIDWEGVFNATYPAGGGIMTFSVIDPELPCRLTKDDVPGSASYYPYDVEAAKEALTASTYGSADALPKLRVTPRGSDVYNNRALEAMMGMWRENLGLANIEFREQPDGFGEDMEKLNLNRDDAVIRFPDTITYLWTACSSAGPVTDPDGSLLPGYENSEVDDPIFEAMGMDPEDPRRCELAKQAATAFMEDYLQFPFGKYQMTLNARDYVKNYHKGPDVGVIAPWKIYIARS